MEGKGTGGAEDWRRAEVARACAGVVGTVGCRVRAMDTCAKYRLTTKKSAKCRISKSCTRWRALDPSAVATARRNICVSGTGMD